MAEWSIAAVLKTVDLQLFDFRPSEACFLQDWNLKALKVEDFGLQLLQGPLRQGEREKACEAGLIPLSPHKSDYRDGFPYLVFCHISVCANLIESRVGAGFHFHSIIEMRIFVSKYKNRV